MKYIITILFFSLSIIKTSYANDVVQVNIVGSVVATTCNIKTPNQVVDLGGWLTQASSGIGSGVGSNSSYVEYFLDFDCPPGLKVTGQLEGNQYDPANVYYIGLNTESDSAEGVVIEMHFYASSRWQSLVYGSTRTIISKTVAGSNSVKLRSFYRQVDSAIKSGTANSTVTVTISYM